MSNSVVAHVGPPDGARAVVARARPAYYKPEKPNMKSFLLNTSKKWV